MHSFVRPKKEQNCNAWATYEEKGSSPSSKLCHGGLFEGDVFAPCPARYDCQAATYRKSAEESRERKRLPVMTNTGPRNREQPFNRGRIIGSTPTAEGPRNLVRQALEPAYKALAGMPTTHRTREESPVLPGPAVVTPPGHYPVTMQTPYGAPHPMAGLMTPTFLPKERHDIFPRLFANMAQGALGAMGWQVLDYARSVDIFGR